MRVYYRGPYHSFEYPVGPNDPQNQAYTTFLQEPDPDPTSTTAGQDVTPEQAAELITRPGHNFRLVNPADQAQLASIEPPVNPRVAARRARRQAEAAATTAAAAPEVPVTAANLPGGLTPNSPAVPKPTAPAAPKPE